MRQRDLKKMGFELVGHAAVDSGQIMLVDPAYVLPRDGKNASGWIKNEREITYDGLMAHYDEQGYEQDHVTPWGEEFGFITGSFGGDGVYPIYRQRGQYVPTGGIFIDFEPDNEYDEN